MSEVLGALRELLPPGVWLIAAAPLLAVLSGTARKVVQLLVPALILAQVLSFHAAAPGSVDLEWMGYTLDLLHVDALRLLFGTIFALMALIGSVYALHVEDPAQNSAAWVYAGGALGVTFSGDLVAFVLFWEMMALSSSLLVFGRGTPEARRAGLRYLAVHGLGGSVLLMGVVGWIAAGHGTAIVALPPGSGIAAWLILFGVAINAAIPPLGAWLPDAYGEGSVTGSVFLSAFTTKTSVFALIALFPGWEILLYGGVIMALYGVVYAVLENNIRRLLAYHIISQVGYMVAAAGMGTKMALDGGSAHAFSHILYKSLLFMGAGAVVYATGKEKLTELGGLHKSMPWVLGLYAVGAASISGVPLFNGFISKSIVITAAAQGGWGWAELGLTLASVGTFLHTGLKLLWFTFISPTDRKHEVIRPLPKNMYVAMGIGATLCTFFGLPSFGSHAFGYEVLYRILPFGTEYHPYTTHHLMQSIQLLVGTALSFWLLFDKLHGEATVSMDTDWIYRKLLPRPVLALSRGLFAAQGGIGEWMASLARAGITFLQNPLRGSERLFGRGILLPEPVKEDDGLYTENRYRFPVGNALWVILAVFGLLAAFLFAGS
ncbi:MAG: Na(+)/H(+) antiporter subunit D [Deltaproteobacteria bacterium]|nr:Na(+)/H(+) antiporter subunit D [Deltaproteobacteria bacterium]